MIRRAGEMKKEIRENMRGGEGSVAVTHLFEKEDFVAKVRLCARMVIPPGAGIGPHTHEGEDELYAILSGTGTLTDGGVESRVSAGDAVLTGRGRSHSISNTSRVEPLEILAVIVCY
jgi:mannose-6-phosphate isomerase-like protein (cupin superfamily)